MFLINFLSTGSFKFFKSIGTDLNLSTFTSSTVSFDLFKLVGILTSLLMPSLSISTFKAITPLLAAMFDVSTPAASDNSFQVA